MGKYPSELISDMADIFVPARFRAFFESDFRVQGKSVGTFMTYIGYGGLTYYFLVEDTITSSLKGATSKKEILAIYRSYKNHLQKKRGNLYDSLVECIKKNEITYGPLAEEAAELNIEKDAEKIKQLKEEGIHRLAQWLACEGQYEKHNAFIDCPYFGWATKTMIKNLYKQDILGAILNYIKDTLNGDLAAYFVPYAEEYIGKPLFSPTSFSVQLQEVAAEVYGYDVKDDTGLTILQTAYSGYMPPDTPRKVLSSEAKETLQFLSNQVVDIAKFKLDGTVDVSAWEIACLSCNGKPSDGYEERVNSQLHELSAWYYFEKGGLTYHYIDRITPYQDNSGHKRYIIVLGDILKKAIVEHKFISIKKSDYDKLENPLCLILAHFLKSEQILKYPYDDNEDRFENGFIRYDYSVWLQNVNFQSRNKSEIFLLIEDALREFKEKRVIVNEYIRRQDDFLIKFFIPSQYEIEKKS